MRALLCVLMAGLTLTVQAQTWRLAKVEAGVKVYLSPMAGSNYQAFRAQVVINAPLERVLALQEDVEGSCAWIHACSSQKLLKKDADSVWVHSYFSMPWPVKTRDSVVKLTTRRSAAGQYERQIEGVPGYLPEQKDAVRVQSVKGFWQLVPVSAGQTQVIYQLHTEPGGSVPSWLANSFVVEAPLNTLKALKLRAERQ